MYDSIRHALWFLGKSIGVLIPTGFVMLEVPASVPMLGPITAVALVALLFEQTRQVVDEETTMDGTDGPVSTD